MTYSLAYITLVLGLGLATEATQIPTEKEYTNSIGMKFVRIEPGTFDMGYGDGGELPREILGAREHGGRDIGLSQFGKKGDFDEHPTHKVTITRPFYMGIYEVTNHLYERFDPLHICTYEAKEVSQSTMTRRLFLSTGTRQRHFVTG